MIRRVAVRAMVVRDGKLLCVQLKPYNEVSVTMTNSWCLPGGGLDEGESLVAGLEREIYEELGIKPKVGNLLYIQQFQYNEKDYLEMFFHVTNTEDFLDIDLSKTTHGASEINQVDFVDPASTPILPKFLMIENITEKIANNSSPTIFSY